jgi:hypothetical protein
MKQYKVTLLMSLSILLHSAAFTQPAGSGTLPDPYQIGSASDLVWLSGRTDLWSAGKYFIQVADIDLKSVENFSPIGNATTPAILHYDGQNYKIDSLKITSGDTLLGLFGYLQSGSLKNIRINEAKIVSTATYANTYVGTLAGRIGGTIFNCQATNSAVSSIGDHVGGLVGSSTGTIQQCYAWTHTSGRNYVGGIAGSLVGGTIRACFIHGRITAINLGAGAMAGLVDAGALVSNCYIKDKALSSSLVSAYNNAGGIAGLKGSGAATIEYCYVASDVEIEATNSPRNIGAISGDAGIVQVKCLYDNVVTYNGNMGTGATPHTPAWFTIGKNFMDEGWDFLCETTNGTNDYWKIEFTENLGYPRLTWDGEPYSANCKEWVGSWSTDWGNAFNWLPTGVPASGEAIYIRNNAANNPILDRNVQLSNVIFGGGSNATRLILGNYNLTVGNIMNAGVENNVRTNSTGKVIKTLAPGESFTFPVGVTGYAPVTITNNTGSGDVFSVRTFVGVYENGYSGATKNVTGVWRTWDISKNSANSGSGVDFVFNWADDDVIAPFLQPVVMHHNGSAWEKYYNNLSRRGNSVAFHGYTGTFSPFVVVDYATALPVSWGNVSVNRQQAGALVKWSTLSEVNAALYHVQHSSNGSEWTTVGTVAAKGNVDAKVDYEFLHANPVVGKNYYHIVQHDIDGKRIVSKTVSLLWTSGYSFQVYPNPATGGTVQVIAQQAGTLQVFNTAGVLVKKVQVNEGTNSVDISKMLKGVYVLVLGEKSMTLVVR